MNEIWRFKPPSVRLAAINSVGGRILMSSPRLGSKGRTKIPILLAQSDFVAQAPRLYPFNIIKVPSLAWLILNQIPYFHCMFLHFQVWAGVWAGSNAGSNLFEPAHNRHFYNMFPTFSGLSRHVSRLRTWLKRIKAISKSWFYNLFLTARGFELPQTLAQIYLSWLTIVTFIHRQTRRS